MPQSGHGACDVANRPEIRTMPSANTLCSTIKPGSDRMLSHAFDPIGSCSFWPGSKTRPQITRSCQICTEFESEPVLRAG